MDQGSDEVPAHSGSDVLFAGVFGGSASRRPIKEVLVSAYDAASGTRYRGDGFANTASTRKLKLLVESRDFNAYNLPMTTNGTTMTPLDAANAALERPFARWLRRQQEAGGGALEATAACVLMEEIRCARALAETLVPGYFSTAQIMRLRAAIFEARATVDAATAADFAAETRADASKPFGVWLAEQARTRSGLTPPAATSLAMDAAAACVVYETFRCAQSVAKDHFGKMSIDDVFEAYDALIEHQERIQGNAESDAAPA